MHHSDNAINRLSTNWPIAPDGECFRDGRWQVWCHECGATGCPACGGTGWQNRRPYAAGDVVDVVDLRDHEVVQQATEIVRVYDTTLPGRTAAVTVADLACGFAVSVRCLRRTKSG